MFSFGEDGHADAEVRPAAANDLCVKLVSFMTEEMSASK